MFGLGGSKFSSEKAILKIQEINQVYDQYSYGQIDDNQFKNLLKRSVGDLNKIL
jgi:hypothetical protein